MDSKIINKKINDIFASKTFDELPEKAVGQLHELLKGFEFNDNDDLRLVLARTYQQYIAKFNFAWSRLFLSIANDDGRKELTKIT